MPDVENATSTPTLTTVDLGVSLVHLVSGEDVIARVEYDQNNGIYLLYRPVTPLMRPKLNEQGEQVGAAMNMVPYRAYLDPEEPLLIRDGLGVLFVGKLQAQLVNHYLSITSGILVADPRSVGSNLGDIRA